MEQYLNLSGQSAVTRYEIGPDFILVQFQDPVIYRYDYEHPGPVRVAAMKRLARLGRGLGTYISQHVRQEYTRREG